MRVHMCQASILPRPEKDLCNSCIVYATQELVLEQLTAHQMMLSNSQVAQGTTASGNGPRVRRFCQKLLAGNP